MQGMCRNKVRVWYANHEQTQEVLLDDGAHTGRFRVVRGPVRELWTNVSTPSGLTNNNISGKVQRELFGQYPDYTLTINPLPASCDMTETSVLWIDTVPQIDENGMTDTPYDHVVVRIAGALNWRAAQAQRVDRTHDVVAAEGAGA